MSQVLGKVIAIAGPPGSGKTALVKALATALNAHSLFYDDFQQVTSQSMEEVMHWMQQGENYDRLQVPGFAEAISQHKQKSPTQSLVIETPLGRHHSASGQHIDFLIWLDTPLDVSLARNIKAFTHDFLTPPIHAQQLAEQVQWLHHYVDMYMDNVRATLTTQQTRVGGDADCVLNGLETPEVALKNALNAIQNFMQGTH